MRVQDLLGVARTHQEAYPRDHITAHLSERLLMSMYGAHLEAGAWCYVAEAGDTIVGFIVGGRNTISSRTISDFQRRHRWVLIAAVLTAPVLWPLVLRRLRTAVVRAWRRRHRAATTGPDDPTPVAELLSVSVRPAHQASRVAQDLVEAFGQRAFREGYTEYRFGVRPSNTRAVVFFSRLARRPSQTNGDLVWFRVACVNAPTVPASDAPRATGAPSASP